MSNKKTNTVRFTLVNYHIINLSLFESALRENLGQPSQTRQTQLHAWRYYPSRFFPCKGALESFISISMITANWWSWSHCACHTTSMFLHKRFTMVKLLGWMCVYQQWVRCIQTRQYSSASCSDTAAFQSTQLYCECSSCVKTLISAS